jgi:hypothetical protein
LNARNALWQITPGDLSPEKVTSKRLRALTIEQPECLSEHSSAHSIFANLRAFTSTASSYSTAARDAYACDTALAWSSLRADLLLNDSRPILPLVCVLGRRSNSDDIAARESLSRQEALDELAWLELE